MEIKRFVAVIYVILGIYSTGICCSSQASFLDEGDSQYNKASHIFQNYIAESYSSEHNSLLDTEFQDFIMHKLSLGSCDLVQIRPKLNLKLSVLHRHLIGEGSHRRLSSYIVFENKADSISEFPVHSCKAIIIERLPLGVFADPFEIESLLRYGMFTDAAVFGDTNLELPSFLSSRSIVEVHKDMGYNIFSDKKHKLGIGIEVPLHARYPVCCCPLGKMAFQGLNLAHRTYYYTVALRLSHHIIRAVYFRQLLIPKIFLLCGKFLVESRNTGELYRLLRLFRQLYQPL